jgi:ATP-dependent Lhr-like helicase
VFARWADHEALVAAERIDLVKPALSDAKVDPLPPAFAAGTIEPEDVVRRTVQGWMECLGPITSCALAAFLGIAEGKIEAALLQLESEGIVLRGQFTPAHGAVEWCDRRLLARIHRLTIGRLRREIESVSPADFIRFLLRWQHVYPGTQLHGHDGVAAVIGQLQGMELPAPAWERDVLPARISLYNPADLEQLCLAGEIVWCRLRITSVTEEETGAVGASRGRRAAPTRAAPLAFVLREALPHLLEPVPHHGDLLCDLSPAGRETFAFLRQHGAAFLSDIARGTGRLPVETENALWELVARGFVTGDGIAGLRTLLLPEVKRRQPRRRLHGIRGGAGRRLMPVGRWAVLRALEAEPRIGQPKGDEALARQLLRRYGVVVRELLAREVRAPAWRVLLNIYRRLEARGEIRGGRFVAGLVGEQFALPEAVETLRAVRRAGDDEVVMVSASDPLNLLGILTPGARVSPFSNQVIAYRNGVPAGMGERGAVISALQSALQGSAFTGVRGRLDRRGEGDRR